MWGNELEPTQSKRVGCTEGKLLWRFDVKACKSMHHSSPTSLSLRRIEQKIPGKRSQKWRCKRLSQDLKRKKASALGCEATASQVNLWDFWWQSRWGGEPSLPRPLKAPRTALQRVGALALERSERVRGRAHLCIPDPKSNNWHIYSSMFRSGLWRMTGWGIKTKPMGDVGGKLRDFTGCARSRTHTHIHQAWEHNDHETGWLLQKKRHTSRKHFQTRTHAQPDIARGEG